MPYPVDAVVVGAATWGHSLESVRRGGTIVINGITTGPRADTDLLRIFVEQIDVRGTIMGTLADMKAMTQFIIDRKITPEIGNVVPMTSAREAIAQMIDDKTHGKTVFTR
jgi:D-arabinose 1-dehydrogenase-like Zn-dependent alcohol dehydrogenase